MAFITKTMINRAVITVLLFSSFTSTLAQYSGIPQPYPCWVLKVRIGQAGASGFLLQASNSVYIVTARHVLFNTVICSNGLCFTNVPFIATNSCTTNYFLISTNAIFSAYYPDQPAGQETREMDVDLQTLLDRGEVRYSKIHDVAIVWIPEDAQVELMTKRSHK